MIRRDLQAHVRKAAGHYPVVTVTGPRQSGKTTLCRAVFPRKTYVSLEPLDVRDFALRDPRGFLAEHRAGAVIDEVQHVPGLLSYLQAEIDEDPRPGRFVLTGSQQFGLLAAITQSLAGRTAVLQLLPLGLNELRRFAEPPEGLFATLFMGAYPRVFDRGIPPRRWFSDYVATYVQRDVRQLLQISDLATFSSFLKLCAGRTGQEINLSALGADAGVSHNTARAWLSVLEASYICFRLPAWHRNVTKQVIKAAKLHFFDSGLVCHLLGIREPRELVHHPQRGAIFESWTAAEIFKARAHAAREPNLSHFRDAKRGEVDLVVEAEEATLLVEAKSGATVDNDFFTRLAAVATRLQSKGGSRPIERRIVYGGEARQKRSDVTVLPWSAIASATWA